jgi:hypothetical protein
MSRNLLILSALLYCQNTSDVITEVDHCYMLGTARLSRQNA